MQLSNGDLLGPYQITGRIGEGGMGEVWKARDTRLDRSVALKVSKQSFSDRFQREARTVAALQHPHICTLFDVGADYLVMEFIDGKPLSGPLPHDRALDYARQILDALDAAHRKGIVHRDLKPANILVTRQGIKLLDFGLAKFDSKVSAAVPESVTTSLTAEQTLVGTLQYMSPEQLQGRDADARSDLFAFGLVWYEMLTGKPAFSAASTASLIADLMHRDPPLASLEPPLSPALERILARCLAKDPDERWQTARDLKAALDLPPGAVAPAGPGASPANQFARRTWIGIAAVTPLAAAAGWMQWRPAKPDAPRWQLSILPPEGDELGVVGGQSSNPAISPDGTMLVFRGRKGVYLRRLDSIAAQLLPGAEGAASSFWSPDSKSLASFTNRNVTRMAVPDGSSEVLTTLSSPHRGGAWGNGGILIGGIGGKLTWVPEHGGNSTRLDPGTAAHEGIWPDFLPDGENFLFSSVDYATSEVSVYLAAVRDGKVTHPATLLRRNATAARCGPGGEILFVQDDNLYAQSLDLSARRLNGEARLVLRNVASAPAFFTAHFSVSRNGVIAWRPGKAAVAPLTWFDREGHELGTVGPRLDYWSVRISPDEKNVLAGSDPTSWFLDASGHGQTRLSDVSWYAWRPDSAAFLFSSHDLLTVLESSISNPSQSRVIASLPQPARLADVAPDGSLLLLTQDALTLLRPDGGAGAVLARIPAQSGEQIHSARLSPDARWVVYAARANSPLELYVQPLAVPGPRKQISAKGGAQPCWRGDGKEILYRSAGGVWSVKVESAGSEVRTGPAAMLFQCRNSPAAVTGGYALAATRDGSRILVPQSIEQPGTGVIHVAAALLAPH